MLMPTLKAGVGHACVLKHWERNAIINSSNTCRIIRIAVCQMLIPILKVSFDSGQKTDKWSNIIQCQCSKLAARHFLFAQQPHVAFMFLDSNIGSLDAACGTDFIQKLCISETVIITCPFRGRMYTGT